ncbi:MAG TPA: thiosulfate oxidation carrier protein SoxY [Rhodocyclaceae bacterium]|nr:thiosulfate oxidation carrier protein SoxY [Rhodocyclaceae bacterium]
MNEMRRSALQRLSRGGALAVLFAAGLMRPIKALAAEWSSAAFEAKDVPAALKGIGAAGAAESKDVVLNAPGIAENGAVVPISVVSNLPNTTQISILVDANPFPLAGSFDLANGALPDVGVRLKFSKSSTVRAVVLAGGKTYTTQKEVKVTAGGCGG